MSSSDDRDRFELFSWLEAVIGTDAARTLMGRLPPMRWDELASARELGLVKTDVAALKTDVAALKTDVAGLKTDVAGLKTDVAGLKTDVAGLKTDVAGLKTDVADLNSDVAGVKTDTTDLKIELREFRAEFRSFRSELNHRFEAVAVTVGAARDEVLAATRGEVVTALAGQTRAIIFAMMATVAAVGGLALTLARLVGTSP